MSQYPSLPLPALAPGVEPPDKCPCCGSARRAYTAAYFGGFDHFRGERFKASVQYACGAGYNLDSAGEWHIGATSVCSEYGCGGEDVLCPRPSPAAVVKALGLVESLRAILASLTPEQRAIEINVAYNEEHSGYYRERLDETAALIADALENRNADPA